MKAVMRRCSRAQYVIHCTYFWQKTISTFILITYQAFLKEATEALQKDIEKNINERIFGQVDCPSNWQYPKKDDGMLGVIKFANWRARRIVEEIDGLIDVCVTTDEERQRWKDVLKSYQNTIKVCYFLFHSIL